MRPSDLAGPIPDDGIAGAQALTSGSPAPAGGTSRHVWRRAPACCDGHCSRWCIITSLSPNTHTHTHTTPRHNPAHKCGPHRRQRCSVGVWCWAPRSPCRSLPCAPHDHDTWITSGESSSCTMRMVSTDAKCFNSTSTSACDGDTCASHACQAAEALAQKCAARDAPETRAAGVRRAPPAW